LFWLWQRLKNYNDSFKNLVGKKLDKAIPGSAFGDDSSIRLSFATDTQSIKKGLERLKNFCQRI
jgi:aspartate aminotransferase